jgi:hypothetical protein
MLKTTSRTKIKSGVGKDYFRNNHSGKSFIACLVELIKNCSDWGMTVIWLITADSKSLTVIDDGEGMTSANCDAFFSLGLSTASGKQTGKYGSGRAMMIYSFAKRVTVRTIVRGEDPNVVKVFSFTKDEFDRAVRTEGELEAELQFKNPKTWPHPFATGTSITFEFDDPSNPDIMRGKKLCKELSARLPTVVLDMIRVDDMSLPTKVLIGEIFRYEENHPQLGQIALELYRPKDKHTEEDLRLGAGFMGEVPMSNFEKGLRMLRHMLPEVFSSRAVAGQMTFPFLRDFVESDRFTLKEGLHRDKATTYVLHLLKRLAPEVQRVLQLSGPTSAGQPDEVVHEEIKQIFNKRYNPRGEDPPDIEVDDPPPPPPPPSVPPEIRQPSKKGLMLRADREYEVGEVISVAAKIREDLAAEFALKDLIWNDRDALAKFVATTDGGRDYKATKPGQGSISALIKGTPYGANVVYEVLPERTFKLSLPRATVRVGGQFNIYGLNTDKLKGRIKWSMSGPGEIEEHGTACTFIATKAGVARVVASDDKDPKVWADCTVEVLKARVDALKIQDHWFLEATRADAFDPRPVKMNVLDEERKLHEVQYNPASPGYAAAKANGTLHQMLMQALALEYPRFVSLDLEKRLKHRDPGDIPVILTEITRKGYEVYAEITR